VIWVPGPRSQPIWPASEYGSKNRSKRAHFFKKRSRSTFLELYDKWKPIRHCVAKDRPRARNRGHKSLLLQTMTALLDYNFIFMCGKGLNYIDLRSVLAIDRSQGCTMTWYSYHTATYYKWPNLCFDRNPNMSPVHPQGGRRLNFGQPVPCPTPGRIDRNSTVLWANLNRHYYPFQCNNLFRPRYSPIDLARPTLRAYFIFWSTYLE